MQPFVYNSAPSRVIFGRGASLSLAAELDRLGLKRALVLSTPQQEEQSLSIASNLEWRLAGSFHEAAMHTPTDVTAAGVGLAREINADCLVAIGGGSTIGLGKAIA